VADAASALAGLRAEVDAIDERLAMLLALRFEKTDALGICKALLGEEPRDAQRQLQRQRLLQALVERHRLPAELVFELYRCISAEAVVRHRAAGCRGGGA